MNLGNTGFSNNKRKKVKEVVFNLQGKVPDSTVFGCASLQKTDGQVFEAAVVASHQDFGFQAALQKLGTTRNPFWQAALFNEKLPRR